MRVYKCVNTKNNPGCSEIRKSRNSKECKSCSRYKGETFKCKNCDKLVYKTKSCGTVYCSRICFSISQLGVNNTFYGKTHSSKTMEKIKASNKTVLAQVYLDPIKYEKRFGKSISFNKSDIKREHMSNVISEKISSGQFNPHSNHKNGRYISNITGNEESYHSIFELAYMICLDEQKVPWTKKHYIRIPYIILDSSKHNYVPDFIIGKNIIEIKPSTLLNYQNNPIKFKAAKKYCKLNGYSFKIVTEKELGDYIIKARTLHETKNSK